MGLFDMFSKRVEQERLKALSARERAVTMSLQQLIEVASRPTSLTVNGAYCQVISQRLSDVSDSELKRLFQFYETRSMGVRNVLGTELVKRGLYRSENGLFIPDKEGH